MSSNSENHFHLWKYAKYPMSGRPMRWCDGCGVRQRISKSGRWKTDKKPIAKLTVVNSDE